MPNGSKQGFLHSMAGAVAVLAMCACSNPGSSSLSVPSSATSAHVPAQAPASAKGGLPDLYVADYDTGSIRRFKNSDLSPDGMITDGVNGPFDVSLDRFGNLFVANAIGVNVTEYPPGASLPTFTYSSGMIEPIYVTNDARGNVYEVDSGSPYGRSGDGFVNEYAPHSNTVMRSCAPGGHPMGIAIDGKGDVFLAFNNPSDLGRVLEYKRGLSGCKATMLGVRLSYVTGIALDTKLDLIAADYNRDEVFVYAPPYVKVKREFRHGTGEGPYYVAINGSGSLLYVTSLDRSGVFVIDYASRRIIRKLTGSAGEFDGPRSF